jgi:uncharacterized protein YgiM (DUF1202 family)
LKVFLTLLLIAAASAAYYLSVYRPAHSRAGVAYALDQSVDVVDSPTAIHTIVGRLKQGERIEVRGHTRAWVRVRLADGQTGWVEAKSLLDRPTYEAGQRLLSECQQLLPQAVGHAGNVVNLHLEPSRDAPPIAQLRERQKVEILGRHLAERSPQPTNLTPAPSGEGPAAASPQPEAWYLVRADAQAGWVLGRLVDLDIPEPIGVYAQGTNLVAWLVLNTIDDHGQRVPQYLVADRAGTQEVDFNHIRVLTWSKDHHRYATAYVESNLNGYFPIQVGHLGAMPYFRLRLMDADGRKIQKIHGLFDTVPRPLGTVEGWESNVMPAGQVSERKQIHRGRPAQGRHTS